jgi:hypothetical protein
MSNVFSFINPKFIRVNYKVIKKNTNKSLKNRIKLIVKNQNKITEQSVSVLNDSAVNEFIHFLKFYNLTNEQYNSVVYIIFYELIWFGIKLIKIHSDNNKENISEEDTEIMLQQLIINITVYILLKNLLINNLIYNLNN